MTITRQFVPTLLLICCMGTAHGDINTARMAMENPDNPLLLMRTSRGDVYLELFPQAAPRNVANFIALAHGDVPLEPSESPAEVSPPVGSAAGSATGSATGSAAGSAAGSGESPVPSSPSPYYDNLTFHRVLPGFLVQSGAPRTPGSPIPAYWIEDEINARQLGLHEQKVLDETGNPHPWLNLQDAADFQRQILVPLYRRLGITTPRMLETRQSEVFSTLSDMTLQQAYENMGYRYNERLTSREPLRGAVAMAGSAPNTNRSEFFIALNDAPWLAGRATIIGQVVEGMGVIDLISQAPTTNRGTIYTIRQVSPTP